MATWSLCTKLGSEHQKQKVFINLDNVITVELLGDRTSITKRWGFLNRRNEEAPEGGCQGFFRSCLTIDDCRLAAARTIDG